MKFIFRKITLLFLIVNASVLIAEAQSFQRDFPIKQGGTIEIINRFGRVEIVAEAAGQDESAEETDAPKTEEKAFLTANSAFESELKITAAGGKIKIEVAPTDPKKRIDLSFKIPERARLKIETDAGEAMIVGDFESVEIKTETGTIAADVPLEDVRYDFVWTESRPRFLSDIELEEIEEKSAGKFVVKGRIGEKEKRRRGEEEKKDSNQSDETNDEQGEDARVSKDADSKSESEKPKTKKERRKTVKLNFTTARGIVLLNVPPSEVSSDLRTRPLTNAAKAIIRSGDSLLTDAIRRASPKYFGDYARTLPPAKRQPILIEKSPAQNQANSQIKKVLARVLDGNNRAIADLKPQDFEVTETNEQREILSVEPSTAPFNLVLLLDVSGSVDNYVNFIRKAARSFVNTVDKNDKIAIIIFNEDVQVISNFTIDKTVLSESLDTFDAGGATALYDSLGYVLTETLRPLKGERTAIVALTDGDDNRSFLSFDSLLGSLQESGALVYPLYVPSTLIASSVNPNQTIDPLRARYTGLTTKAEGEGEKLAKISGGVYYPITQIDQIQKAYDDIVLQLRTAYSITFRSNLPEVSDKTTASPRLKVKVKRENAFVKLGSVVAVEQKESSENVFPLRRKAREDDVFASIFCELCAFTGRCFSIRRNFSRHRKDQVQTVFGRQSENPKSQYFRHQQIAGAFLLSNAKIEQRF